MKNKLTLHVTLVLLLYSTLTLLGQQDPMFTKYMFNSQVFNPGYAGSKDYLSVNILAREQWWGAQSTTPSGSSLNYGPSTQTFTLQNPVGERVSLGLTAINDRIGATSSSTLNAVYAYHFSFGEQGELSIGLQGGLTNYRADWSSLTFKDPRLTDVVYAEETPTRIIPNVGIGLYYHSEKFYVGLSVPHIIEYDLRATEINEARLGQNVAKYYRHYYLTAGAAIPISGQDLVFKPSILIKNVGFLTDFSASQNAVNQVGAPTQFDIDLSLFFYRTLWLGVSFRSAFEVEALGGISTVDSGDIWLSYYLKNGTRIGIAYDYTLSKLSTIQKGTFELMVGYDFNYTVEKVNTPRYF